MGGLVALGLPVAEVAAWLPAPHRGAQVVTLTVRQKGRAGWRVELKGAGARRPRPAPARTAEAANR